MADVHAYSCYLTTVRCLGYDPGANASLLIFRATDGLLYALIGTSYNGAYTRQGSLVGGGVRYPNTMCVLVEQKPYAFYYRGWGSDEEGGRCYLG